MGGGGGAVGSPSTPAGATDTFESDGRCQLAETKRVVSPPGALGVVHQLVEIRGQGRGPDVFAGQVTTGAPVVEADAQVEVREIHPRPNERPSLGLGERGVRSRREVAW